MQTKSNMEIPSIKKGIRRIQNDRVKLNKVFMGNRVCDNCGKTKDTYGGKTCSHGHFICHSCASGHDHCPLCGHSLR
jgi:transposase-like protein